MTSFPTADDEAFLKKVAELRKAGATVSANTQQDNAGNVTRYLTVSWLTHNPAARVI